MKIARLMLALGLAFAASAGATSTAMAANATYTPRAAARVRAGRIAEGDRRRNGAVARCTDFIG